MTFNFRARAYKRKTAKSGMSSYEKEYKNTLEQQRLAGQLLWYKYEGVKLRLADNTFYTPDFLVINMKGEVEMHEVKGYWEDKGRVKIKVAAAQYPFRFVAITKKSRKEGSGWEYEEF